MKGAEHLVTRQRGANGDFSGFVVTDFPDHHHIGILAKDGAKSVGKIEITAGSNRYLRHAMEFIFHRVFDGEDLQFLGVNTLKNGVERGGFTTAGGTRGEEQTVGFSHEPGEQVGAHRIEAKVLVRLHSLVLHQQTQHHAFTINRWHGSHADIHAIAAMMNLDMAVLRHETLGDIHVRHDLDAGNQGCVKLLGRRWLVLEQSIDAIAQLDGLDEGDQVNIAGSFL